MLKLLFQDAKDRLKGNKARANARLGLVSAPQGTGKLIWLAAGDSCDSVVMAAALLAAIREKRQDVRLVLTYQTEYQDVVAGQLSGLSASGLKKIGFGYGVGDNVLAVKQMLKRLSPFAVIFVGHQPHRSLIKLLASKPDIHKIAFQFTPHDFSSADLYEACYPDTISPVAAKGAAKNTQLDFQYASVPFNVLTRLVQSQIDKQLGALLCGEDSAAIFHFHNLDSDQLDNALSQWQQAKVSTNTLLALSFSAQDKKTLFTLSASLSHAVEKAGYKPVLLSCWNKKPLLNNEIIIVDETKWYAAICTASTGTHLFETDAVHFWQAIASGAVISYAKQNKNSDSIARGFIENLFSTDLFVDIYQYWFDLNTDATLQRKRSDAIRKQFWSERREAQTQINELLQRVYDW